MERQKWQVSYQQVPKWRHKLSNDGMTSVFHKNCRICLSSHYLPCVNISSNLHAPIWNDGAQVARWLIWQVPEWRHPALYDAMTSDFGENHRDHFSYQYLACVKNSSWLEHQKWTYCCFYFCTDYENSGHMPNTKTRFPKKPSEIIQTGVIDLAYHKGLRKNNTNSHSETPRR